MSQESTSPSSPSTIPVTVPVFPESVSDGTLVNWHKQPGDSVRRDELLAEIETDKVVFEVPAPADGVLGSILEQEGATVFSGQEIAQLQTGDVEAVIQVKTTDSKPADDAVMVSPAARKMMQQHGLSMEEVRGSGKDGRIGKEDVLAAIHRQHADAEPVSRETETARDKPADIDTNIVQLAGRPQKRVPMSRLRKRIAERLVEAQHNAAMLTTFNEINMQPVMELRKRYKEQFEKTHGVRLGLMSFFVKAVVEVLKRYPQINASIDGDDIVYHGFFDIGIAVSSPRGLVVPILKDADKMDMAGIESTIKDFGERARNGGLLLEEISGGTFTITNGGVFGSLLSTPILNPPQSGILGMHTIQERPVAEDGKVVIRPMMYVALSYDHRIVDGQDAVQFLVNIKELLEEPARLLLEI